MFGQPFYLGHFGRTPVYVGGDILFMVVLVYIWNADRGMVQFAISLMTLFLAVLFHEAGHAAVARMQGKQGVTIVIGAFGGVCVYAADRQRLSDVFIQVAGVFVNFMLAGAAWLVHQHVPMGSPLLVACVWSFFTWNFVLGIFNSLPIYPQDGGQIVLTLTSAVMRVDRARRLTLAVTITAAVVTLFLIYHFFGTISAFTLVMIALLVFTAFRQLR